ncbi:MAG: Hsp20/alpha crystallin family protein [Calditrichaeota bacterium]|nr:Hsp20/alpha crystallin family protein [Calditrichota bacterium]MCB9368489.1 Hsp20/alpha crystallin family protein [Calditrichota bacterium]
MPTLQYSGKKSGGSFRFEYLRIESGHRPIPWSEHTQWSPAIDLYGNESVVVLEVHLPDIAPEETTIEFIQNRVRISGQRKDIGLPGRREFFHVEIPRGHFQREVVLPNGVDIPKAEAKFELGVLKIVVPWINREWAVAVRSARFPEEWS